MFKRLFSGTFVLAFAIGFVLPFAAPGTAAPTRFFMGEDIIGPRGLLISVNQVVRKAFTSGLNSDKKEQFEIQMTFVSTGHSPFQIDPLNDFVLAFGEFTFPPISTPQGGCLDRQFTVNPGTQSRGSLFFALPSASAEGVPQLRYTGTPEPLVILCDPDLAGLFEKSRQSPLGADDCLKLSRFLYDAERYVDAKQALESSISGSGSDPRLMLQMAMVDQKLGNPEEARALLTRLGLNSQLDSEDALTLAKQAFEVGQYDLAQKVLEPLAAAGKLGDLELTLLARCLYYSKELDKAERMFNDLQSRGVQNKTIFFTLGNIAEKRDDINSAIKWWEKAFAADPSYYEALFNIGVGYFKLDDKKKAAEAWRKVLLLNPDSETRKIAEEALGNIE